MTLTNLIIFLKRKNIRRYCIEILTPETMKLLGSTEKKINKNKNGKNVPHLENSEVVLVHCNDVNNYYQRD